MSARVVPLHARRGPSGPVPQPEPARSADAAHDCPTCRARELLAEVTRHAYAHQDADDLLVPTSGVAELLAIIRDDLAGIVARVDTINRGHGPADHINESHQ